MTKLTLTGARIRAGTWDAVITGQAEMPRIEVLHLEMPLDGVRISDVQGRPDQWAVQVPIPAQALNDGVQTFVIRNAVTGETFGHFTMITGIAMEDDIRAEVDLLRAELDLLKRAFRRHCVETTG